MKKLKQLLGLAVVVLCIIMLILGLLMIWNVIGSEAAQEGLLKTIYTLGAILAASLIIMGADKLTK